MRLEGEDGEDGDGHNFPWALDSLTLEDCFRQGSLHLSTRVP